MNLPYLAVVAVGAITLVVEAYRQFSIPITVYTHERYPILRGVDLDALCTRAELIRGFLIYVMLYLGSYAIILGSAELLDVVGAGSGAPTKGPSGEVGAGDGLESGGYSTPLIVSAAIIAALTIGMFAPAERAVRSFSHRLAGIPRGVYKHITRLNRIDFTKLGADFALPLVGEYEKKLHVAGASTVYDELTKDTISILTVIDLLSPAVVGGLRDKLFSEFPSSALEELINQQAEDLKVLKTELSDLQDNPDSLQSFQDMALKARNNIQALFSVLYIRNDRSIASVGRRSPMRHIASQMQTSHDPIVQSLTGAILIAGVMTIFLTPLISLFFTPSFSEDWLTIATGYGLRSAITSVAMFAAAAGLAVLAREGQQERNRWATWTFNRIPFLRFTTSGWLSAFAVVLVSASLVLIESVLYTGIPTLAQIRDDYVYGGLFYLFTFPFGFLVAICVFVIVDQHGRLGIFQMQLAAMAIGILYLGWAVITVIYTYPSDLITLERMREILYLGVPAIIFFLAFATLIELTEEHRNA